MTTCVQRTVWSLWSGYY